LDEYPGIKSSPTGESGFGTRSDQHLRAPDSLPPKGVTSYHWDSRELHLTGPDDIGSTRAYAPESDSICSTSDQIVETDFAELENGTLVDLVQDPGNPSRTLLAVWKDGQLRYQDQLETNGR